jgi:flagellar biogenesis protein FliO
MDFIQPFAAVLLVLGLLCGLLWLLNRRGAATFRLPRLAGTEPRRLELLERVSLGPQHALHLVRISGKSLVIVTSPAACQIVSQMDEGAGH